LPALIVNFVKTLHLLYCRFLDSCVVRWIDPCGDQVRRIDVMLYRETFRNALYYDIYIDGLYLLFLCVGPMTTLIFMNIRLVQAIRYDSCVSFNFEPVPIDSDKLT